MATIENNFKIKVMKISESLNKKCEQTKIILSVDFSLVIYIKTINYANRI